MNVIDLIKKYDGKSVVNSVSFEIPKGKVLSLIGPNGAGKSTVMGMISRLIAKDSGAIDFEGTDLSKWNSKELAKKLSILTQHNNIQMKLTVRELVAFGRFPYSGSRLTAEDNEMIDKAIAYMELQEFEDRFIDELSGGQRQRAYIAMVIAQDTTMITDVFNVVVLIAGGLFLYNGKINFADYSAFIVSINLFLGPVNTLIRFMEQFQNGVAGFERFVEIMETAPEKDGENAQPVTRLEGEIEFRNVSSSYTEGKEILKNVCLSIGKGKTFALVGPSGGGKTTLCHLIPQFYRISDGDILIDGKSMENITMDSLRRNIGIVQQDIYLFNSSIRENILYGRLDATDEEIIEAAKRANIHDYIMSLDKGYDTEIGERGVRLSGGQKQRLCIARVFLKNPPILILDEATSALDNATEIQIQKSLDELSEGRTTIVVAHRLSTIKNADEIAVVDNGEITEQGSHDELVKLNGTYAQLYRQQFREV